MNGSFVTGCFDRAKSLGFSIFAVQNGGECFTSGGAHETYNKYGVSSDCVSGNGGYWANNVYERGNDFALTYCYVFDHFVSECLIELYDFCFPIIKQDRRSNAWIHMDGQVELNA